MNRWELRTDLKWDGASGLTGMATSEDGQYLKRDEVIDALERCGLELDEGLDQVLEVLGISEDEFDAAVDRNHPGPDPDYSGSSVLDYSRGVR